MVLLGISLPSRRLLGAWFGAGAPTRLKSETLYKAIAICGVDRLHSDGRPRRGRRGASVYHGPAQIVVGVVAGFAFGVGQTCSVLPRVNCLSLRCFCCLARTSSSPEVYRSRCACPRCWLGFARSSRDRSFRVLGRNRRFASPSWRSVQFSVPSSGAVTLGSCQASFFCRCCAGAILLISAVKVWRHQWRRTTRAAQRTSDPPHAGVEQVIVIARHALGPERLDLRLRDTSVPHRVGRLADPGGFI